MVNESEWEALSDRICDFDDDVVRNKGSFEKTFIFKLTEKQQSFRKQPFIFILDVKEGKKRLNKNNVNNVKILLRLGINIEYFL